MTTWRGFRCTCTTLLAIAALAVLAPAPAEAGVPIVQPSICRGPGFWGTHAGNERGNTNMVQTLLDEVGCLEVCGEIIDDTDVNSADSAEEGLCVAPKSSGQVRLARFLITQAMNCMISTGTPDCDSEAWAICNAACAANDDPDQMGDCQAYLDCQAEGGHLDEGGNCITGTCQLLAGPAGEGNGGLGCGATVACPDLYTCVPTVGCDDADLVNEELGIDWSDEDNSDNSSSLNRCKRANRTPCAVVGANEEACGSGTEDEAPEECPECTEGFFCGGELQNCEGSTNSACICGTTAEGGTACTGDWSVDCDLMTDCTTSAECAVDEVCILDGCCDEGKCQTVGGEEICIDQAAPAGRGGLAGPTQLMPAKKKK